MKPITKAKPRTQLMIMPARDPPFEDRHKQVKHVMGQKQPGLPTKNMQKNPDDREILQMHPQLCSYHRTVGKTQ